MLDNQYKIWDVLCRLKTASLVAASAPATVNGVAGVFDTGAPVVAGQKGAYTEGKLVLDLAATTEANLATSGTRVRFILEGSTTVNFVTHNNLVDMLWGNVGGPVMASAGWSTSEVGANRYIFPFSNMFGDKVYRYLRLYHFFGGTWGTGINYTAFLSK